MKLSARVASKSHRVLVFGPPKSGKTELVGKLATKFKLLYFDLENGIDTLLKLPAEAQDNVEVFSLPDTRDFPIAVETMLKVIRGNAVTFCETHGKVGCAICKKTEGAIWNTVELNKLDSDTIVVVDSITQLTNSAIAHITKGTDELYKLQTDDWGNLGKLMDIFLSHVQQANFNIVCISHETEVEMQDGKQKLVPTAGTRNFSRNTAKYFDEVVYCEVKNKVHVAGSSTTYANNILTGSRTGLRTEDAKGEASLLPIFTGERPTTNPAVNNTPATTAKSSLEEMRARLAAKKG